ncbi:hypothetical protein LEM8419_00081 [Neolewinella maritima]|uniref:SPOR domain-containing protein n=1 Tax=Neolewinella maritima TaxID=1383882 RepID=A0ABM9AVS5_9BACT|nr:SPOR domain-containing protein [Neolewinella maritima]CAH0998735.1 hypothetical protein LEM8419_00081 [Neolewinella maritima]
MKSSVVVPVILIVCLLALALLISRAFTAANQGEVVPQDSGSYTNSPNSAAQDSFEFSADRENSSSDTERIPRELRPVTADDSQLPSADISGEGNYFVIAGTFRQEINARTRVRDLRKAGFDSTELSTFDRGTYAVALVGRSDDFAEAGALAERVRTAGYEAKVYRKR